MPRNWQFPEKDDRIYGILAEGAGGLGHRVKRWLNWKQAPIRPTASLICELVLSKFFLSPVRVRPGPSTLVPRVGKALLSAFYTGKNQQLNKHCDGWCCPCLLWSSVTSFQFMCVTYCVHWIQGGNFTHIFSMFLTWSPFFHPQGYLWQRNVAFRFVISHLIILLVPYSHARGG